MHEVEVKGMGRRFCNRPCAGKRNYCPNGIKMSKRD